MLSIYISTATRTPAGGSRSVGLPADWRQRRSCLLAVYPGGRRASADPRPECTGFGTNRQKPALRNFSTRSAPAAAAARVSARHAERRRPPHSSVGRGLCRKLIAWAAEQGLCIETGSFKALPPPCGEASRPASDALADAGFYSRIVNAWSTRNLAPGAVSGHDQFFDAFGKFGEISGRRAAEMLAETAVECCRPAGRLHRGHADPGGRPGTGTGAEDRLGSRSR